MYFEDVDLCARAKKQGARKLQSIREREFFTKVRKKFCERAGKEKALLCFARLLYAETFRTNGIRPCEIAAASVLCEECVVKTLKNAELSFSYS